ncbi:MAG: hypothetical protein ACE147_00640 [Candidatus Methylomirabilales bacterium]
MHHCCLLTPAARDVWRNSGHALIVAGIKHLVREAQPDAVFHVIDLMQRDADCWGWARAHADSLVLCGIPRLGSDLRRYRDFGFWEDVLAVKAAGVKVADLFPGVHVAWQPTVEAARDLVLVADCNRTVLAYERSLDLVLPRDAIFAAAAEALGDQYPVMPCGSWWARYWWGIEPRAPDCHVIVVRADERVPAGALVALARHQRALAETRPTVAVTRNAGDFHHAQDAGLQHVALVTESDDLLRLLARADVLVSLCVHATIPALAFGGIGVVNVAIDSRAAAVDAFGVVSHPLEALQAERLPEAQRVSGGLAAQMHLYQERFCRLWKERMC